MAFHPRLKTCVETAMVSSCWGQAVQAASNGVASRNKRQATENCNTAIECPQNVRTMFIPDFNDCNHFYVCNYGQLEDHFCRQYGFQYYNPKNINCEVGTELASTPAPTDNICVNRV
ncbi:uncharacterized protein LOC121376565 [Gigantopelta aegis]|uniref:uncharacterized protein LOC121376565 n=1 Tax=Gigantopelta aegis TaxID=1735272 RepID=UPI001B88C0AB|nr:uncharacterized protein LOC121376565 [Gigantopelta aegis]